MTTRSLLFLNVLIKSCLYSRQLSRPSMPPEQLDRHTSGPWRGQPHCKTNWKLTLSRNAVSSLKLPRFQIIPSKASNELLSYSRIENMFPVHFHEMDRRNHIFIRICAHILKCLFVFSSIFPSFYFIYFSIFFLSQTSRLQILTLCTPHLLPGFIPRGNRCN